MFASKEARPALKPTRNPAPVAGSSMRIASDAQPFERDQRDIQRGAGHHDQKLFAAPSSENIGVADGLAARERELLQHLVAGRHVRNDR